MGASDIVASAYSRLQTVSDVAAPVGDYLGAKLPAVAIPGGPPNPAEMLDQIALDKELFDVFQPVLETLGFSIEAEAQVGDRFGYSRTVTLAKKGEDIVFYLVVIPKSILENSRLSNLAAVGMLEHMLFAPANRLYVISRDLSVMDDGFPDLMDGWSIKGLKVTFVAWSLVAKFLDDIGRRSWRMQQMLKLDAVPVAKPQVKPIAVSQMSIEEEEAVIRIMMQQAISPAFPRTQDYFDTLTRRAYLPDEHRSRLAWKGNAELDARTLIDATKRDPYPDTHEWAGQKEIGWVLRAMLRDSNEEVPTLIDIILTRGLIQDAKVVEELQQKLASTKEQQ